MSDAREAWITGIGIVSCLGEGPDAHWQALIEGKVNADAEGFAPYVVHRVVPLDLDKQIPKKGDQRQMEPWLRIGTYAAGLALDSAGVKGNNELLSRMDMIVAAGGGERDLNVDVSILSGMPSAPNPAAFLNQRLTNDLRPTLFLAQLSNLMAGNISIVHNVTGSSRTFMGEEAAGVDAVRVSLARIAAGQSDIALVGGAYNAERLDIILHYLVDGCLWQGEPAGIWERGAKGGGMALGSMGAFLVLEEKSHAEKRGAKPFARISSVLSEQSRRRDGDIGKTLEKMWAKLPARSGAAVISGATGLEPATSEERAFLASKPDLAVRATGTHVGDGLEPNFVLNIALAAISLARGSLFPSADRSGMERDMDGELTQVVVTSVGHWRGEGLALVEIRELKEGIMTSTRDEAGRPIVVVTGMGVVTSLGAGKTDNWAKLTAGESGIRAIKRFSTDGIKTTIAGTVDFVPVEPLHAPGLAERLAEMAAEEAIEQSNIGTKGDFPGPMFIAVAPVEIEWPQREALASASGANDKLVYGDLLRAAATGRFHGLHTRFLFGSIADHIAERFGTKGSPISLSTACASGATAIQLGVEAIRRGETDSALCIGTDGSVNVETLVRFSLLSALSASNAPPTGASKPFSKNRDGFVMAEGAGALVLESLESAQARGAKILGVMEGCGEAADSFHRTRSSPDGKPIMGCIRNALADAGLAPDDIDYINAHGTGTPENDKMEYLAVAAVLGDHAKSIPISSNKSMIGHTLSAAGAVESVFSFLTLEHQRIPPTINYNVPDPTIPLDVVPNTARDGRVTHVLSNSFGFGGQNVSLVMGREPR